MPIVVKGLGPDGLSKVRGMMIPRDYKITLVINVRTNFALSALVRMLQTSVWPVIGSTATSVQLLSIARAVLKWYLVTNVHRLTSVMIATELSAMTAMVLVLAAMDAEESSVQSAIGSMNVKFAIKNAVSNVN